MRDVSISEFRAKCCAIIETVRNTGQSIQITRFGEPLAVIVPLSIKKHPANWLGRMAGTAEITGDIVGPTGNESDWEAAI